MGSIPTPTVVGLVYMYVYIYIYIYIVFIYICIYIYIYILHFINIYVVPCLVLFRISLMTFMSLMLSFHVVVRVVEDGAPGQCAIIVTPRNAKKYTVTASDASELSSCALGYI